MIYLSEFYFPNIEIETSFIMSQLRTCYDSFYPFKILSRNKLEYISFENITILCGGNGSGKSTALNIIAEKLKIKRDTLYNRSNFYEDYLNLCKSTADAILPEDSRIITSDDVFDYMLNLRAINNGIDNRREELFNQYFQDKYTVMQVKSLDDYDELKRLNRARKSTQSKYIRNTIMDNVREQSNGESAFMYFTDKIKADSIYLLDEPENSLSLDNQKKLAKFVEESARFYNCQFIIATHSPFFLALKEAKIYDLDENPVDTKHWTEVENVKLYYEFFQEHEKQFKKTRD